MIDDCMTSHSSSFPPPAQSEDPADKANSTNRRRLRVALLGGRGLPAKYGGYCTLIEEVAVRLVEDHGFDVTVYCRTHYFTEHPPTFRGVNLVYLPAVTSKHFESLLHTGLSVLHALFCRYDAVCVMDPANAPLMIPFWALRVPHAIHTDGLGWKRRKWGPLARKYYKWVEWVAARLCTELVSDSQSIQRYYREEYGARSVFIPVGGEAGEAANDGALAQYGLESRGYYLIVTRIEPDNNTDLLIRGYKAAKLDRPLIIVGGARYPSDYSRALEREAAPNVRFLGGIYDAALLNGLYANAFAYLHGHEVGGTNPALLRAMYGGVACVALDVVFNRETLGESGTFFSREDGDLGRVLAALEQTPDRTLELGALARKRVETQYRWDAVADAFATLFIEMAAGQDATDAYHPERFVER